MRAKRFFWHLAGNATTDDAPGLFTHLNCEAVSAYKIYKTAM